MTRKPSIAFNTLAGLMILAVVAAHGEVVSIVVPSNAAPRVEFGAEKLADALRAVKLDAAIVDSESVSGRKIHLETPHDSAVGSEGFRFGLTGNDDIAVISGDDSGTLYGCLELAGRIRSRKNAGH